MKISATVATTSELDTHSDHAPLTEEQLTALAKTAKNKPVTKNFDNTEPPLGKVIDAKVENGRLIVEAELFSDLREGGVFLVPGYTIPEYELTECALTTSPADKSLPPIKI